MEDKHQKEIERLKKRVKTLNAKLKKSLETADYFFKACSKATHENELLKKMLKESYRGEQNPLRERLQRYFLHDGD
jgi:hypothetical protein